jgi:hypothetical protein
MRTSFVLGAAVGAAATVYLMNNKQVVYSTMNSTLENVNGMMNDAKDKMVDMAVGAKFGDIHSSNSGLDRVESIVNSEPNIRDDVDEILNRDTYRS